MPRQIQIRTCFFVNPAGWLSGVGASMCLLYLSKKVSEDESADEQDDGRGDNNFFTALHRKRGE